MIPLQQQTISHAIAACLALGLSALAAGSAGAKDLTVGSLTISDPWTRATPAGAKVGAGYVRVTNTGKEADRLIGGTFPQAGNVQIHEMSMASGVMKMKEVTDGLEIKPGATVELKPGSYHIMFMALKQQIKEGAPVAGTLMFQKAGKVEVEYAVRPIGAAGHKGHH